MTSRRYLWIALVLIFLLGSGWSAWWCFGRTPQSEILAAQEKLLTAVEKRDWERVLGMLTEDYLDEWGHDRQSAVQDGKQALAGFFTIDLETQITTLQATKDLGMVKMMIRMEGNGTGFSQFVVTKVNQVQEPWFFHWHKKGRWPWDWKVVQIHNEQIIWAR
tara:strand:- start:37 stop:522 length:486 start_codon:yes stop_codon:yes gene_type:complete